jgi:hypothetical protein
MHSSMTCEAKRDQVMFIIRTRLASESFMVYFELEHRAAKLTFPAVAPQDFRAQLCILPLRKSDARLFRVRLSQGAVL